MTAEQKLNAIKEALENRVDDEVLKRLIQAIKRGRDIQKVLDVEGDLFIDQYEAELCVVAIIKVAFGE